jgi:hypothetical protein
MKVSGLSRIVKTKKNNVYMDDVGELVVDASSRVVCRNTRCGRDITDPIRVENLSGASSETYYACPYCLSPVDAVLDETIKRQELVRRISAELPKKVEIKISNECNYHFGYLKSRPKNTPVPDSCLTCPRMMECLK